MWHSAAAVVARHWACIKVVLTHLTGIIPNLQVVSRADVASATAWAANKSRSPVEHAAARGVATTIAGPAGRAARVPTAGRHSVVRLSHNTTCEESTSGKWRSKSSVRTRVMYMMINNNVNTGAGNVHDDK